MKTRSTMNIPKFTAELSLQSGKPAAQFASLDGPGRSGMDQRVHPAQLIGDECYVFTHCGSGWCDCAICCSTVVIVRGRPFRVSFCQHFDCSPGRL